MENEKRLTARNVYDALLILRRELGPIEKTGRNTFQNYAYQEEAEIFRFAKPIMDRLGLILLVSKTGRSETFYSPEVIVDQTQTTKKVTKPLLLISCNYVFTWFHIPSETKIEMQWQADGADAALGDKGTYIADTQALKYFLKKNLLISDREDAESNENNKGRHEEEAKEKPAQTRAANRQAKPATDTTSEEANREKAKQEERLKLARKTVADITAKAGIKGAQLGDLVKRFSNNRTAMIRGLHLQETIDLYRFLTKAEVDAPTKNKEDNFATPVGNLQRRLDALGVNHDDVATWASDSRTNDITELTKEEIAKAAKYCEGEEAAVAELDRIAGADQMTGGE